MIFSLEIKNIVFFRLLCLYIMVYNLRIFEFVLYFLILLKISIWNAVMRSSITFIIDTPIKSHFNFSHSNHCPSVSRLDNDTSSNNVLVSYLCACIVYFESYTSILWSRISTYRKLLVIWHFNCYKLNFVLCLSRVIILSDNNND